MHISNLTPKVQRPGRKAAATFNCIWLTWTTKGQFLFRLSVPCCRFANCEGSLVLSWETELDICIFPDTKNFPSNWKWIKEWSRCQHLVQNRFECNFRSESLYLYHTADFAAIQHQSWKRDLLLGSQILRQCKCKCNMKCKWNFALPHIKASRWEVQCKGGRRSIPWSNQVRNLPPLVQNFMQAPLFDTTFTAVSRWLLITVFSWQAKMDIFIWWMIIWILMPFWKNSNTKICPHLHNRDSAR